MTGKKLPALPEIDDPNDDPDVNPSSRGSILIQHWVEYEKKAFASRPSDPRQGEESSCEVPEYQQDYPYRKDEEAWPLIS